MSLMPLLTLFSPQKFREITYVKKWQKYIHPENIRWNKNVGIDLPLEHTVLFSYLFCSSFKHFAGSKWRLAGPAADRRARVTASVEQDPRRSREGEHLVDSASPDFLVFFRVPSLYSLFSCVNYGAIHLLCYFQCLLHSPAVDLSE